MLSPADGALVGGDVALEAEASDVEGIAQVEFLVDGAVVATDTTAADGWTAQWTSNAVADGTVTIAAVATDTGGQTATAAGLVVDNTGPSVALVSPAAGSVVAGDVSVTADAADPSGVTTVEFAVNGASWARTRTGSTVGPSPGPRPLWPTASRR
ncbi:MAG: Ig-like domain-containing protein [Ilumatobacteraceae bacterium]